MTPQVGAETQRKPVGGRAPVHRHVGWPALSFLQVQPSEQLTVALHEPAGGGARSAKLFPFMRPFSSRQASGHFEVAQGRWLQAKSVSRLRTMRAGRMGRSKVPRMANIKLNDVKKAFPRAKSDGQYEVRLFDDAGKQLSPGIAKPKPGDPRADWSVRWT